MKKFMKLIILMMIPIMILLNSEVFGVNFNNTKEKKWKTKMLENLKKQYAAEFEIISVDDIDISKKNQSTASNLAFHGCIKDSYTGPFNYFIAYNKNDYVALSFFAYKSYNANLDNYCIGKPAYTVNYDYSVCKKIISYLKEKNIIKNEDNDNVYYVFTNFYKNPTSNTYLFTLNFLDKKILNKTLPTIMPYDDVKYKGELSGTCKFDDNNIIETLNINGDSRKYFNGEEYVTYGKTISKEVNINPNYEIIEEIDENNKKIKKLKISWEKVDDALGYKIYLDKDSTFNNVEYKKIENKDITSYTFETKLLPNTIYSVGICSYNSNSYSKFNRLYNITETVPLDFKTENVKDDDDFYRLTIFYPLVSTTLIDNAKNIHYKIYLKYKDRNEKEFDEVKGYATEYYGNADFGINKFKLGKYLLKDKDYVVVVEGYRSDKQLQYSKSIKVRLNKKSTTNYTNTENTEKSSTTTYKSNNLSNSLGKVTNVGYKTVEAKYEDGTIEENCYSVNIFWDEVKGATGYKIYLTDIKGNPKGDGEYIVDASANSSNLNYVWLLKGIEYKVEVKALWGEKKSQGTTITFKE